MSCNAQDSPHSKDLPGPDSGVLRLGNGPKCAFCPYVPGSWTLVGGASGLTGFNMRRDSQSLMGLSVTYGTVGGNGSS